MGLYDVVVVDMIYDGTRGLLLNIILVENDIGQNQNPTNVQPLAINQFPQFLSLG